MKIVVQRVLQASVSVNNIQGASINRGYLLYVCVEKTDTEKTAKKAAEKIIHLRIMPDDSRPINASIQTTGGEILVVSQFTLCADTSGRRPSFLTAAPPETASTLLTLFVSELTANGISCKTGEFGQHMAVSSLNDGPVTIILNM